MNLFCFDPGKRTGIAFFRNSTLFGSTSVSVEQSTAFSFAAYYVTIVPTPLVIIELPRWYGSNNKVDVNDLINMAVQVGELKNEFRRQHSKVELIAPSDWKGNIDSEIMYNRILKRLDEGETALLEKRPRQKKYDHNMVDAIGMGLWKLGRL